MSKREAKLYLSDIIEAIENPFSGEWNKKSLYFWSFVLGVKAGNTARSL